MTLHQFCRNCKNIMSSEEMDKHLQDYLGLCNKCREDKQHADTFKERIEGLQEEE